MLRLEVLIASKYIVGIKSILHVAVIMYLKVYLKKIFEFKSCRFLPILNLKVFINLQLTKTCYILVLLVVYGII